MNAAAYIHEKLTGKIDFPKFKAGDNITVNNRYIGSFFINGSLPLKECSVVVNINDNDLYGSTKHIFDIWNIEFKLIKTYADGTEYLSR